MELVCELVRRRHVQVVFHNAGDDFLLGLGDLVIAHGKLDLEWVGLAVVGPFGAVDLAHY